MTIEVGMNVIGPYQVHVESVETWKRVDGPVKHDAGKPDPTLVPPKMILAVAKVMGFGAEKYGRDNYRKEPRLDPMRLKAALLRHVLADLDGAVLDEESGLPHLHHAAAALAMLIDGEDND